MFWRGGNDYRFPCDMTLQESVPHDMEFEEFDIFHHKICRRAAPPQIYKRRVEYGKKLFTPSLDFYERLQWVLKNSKVERLILLAFALNDQ